MNNLTVVLDPMKTQGPIRNILGVCNSPIIGGVARMEKEKVLFRKLNPARVRHHDAVIENPGYDIVDVTRIFPLFHADDNDPANYNFAPTDYYFQQAVDCGVPIELKFGERIEHSGRRFKVNPPPDPKKWARICVNILRHYNDGWADGMHLGIQYVSIWEEPDNPTLFDGPFELYLELYRETAAAIRQAFPEVKICGPNTMGPWSGKFEQFVKYCADNKLPLDAAEFTSYSREPGAFAQAAVRASEILKQNGFGKTEIFLSEWHYWPKVFLGNYTGEMEHAENAAFSVSALIRMLNSGVVDMAYYYAWSVGRSFSLVPPAFDPLRVYYALCRYTETTGMRRIEINADLPEDIDLLGGVSEDGRVRLLISCFKAPRAKFELKVPGYTHCRIKRITDADEDYENESELAYDAEHQRFLLDADDGGSAVFSLTFAK